MLHLHELLLALRLDDGHLLLELVVEVHAAQALLLDVEVDGIESAVGNHLWGLTTQHQLQGTRDSQQAPLSMCRIHLLMQVSCIPCTGQSGRAEPALVPC